MVECCSKIDVTVSGQGPKLENLDSSEKAMKRKLIIIDITYSELIKFIKIQFN